MNIKKTRIEYIERCEADNIKFNFRGKYLCLAAVCKHHPERHGELFDADFIRKNYSVEMVQDDCKCSFTLILLNDAGHPISSIAIEKAKSFKIQHDRD